MCGNGVLTAGEQCDDGNIVDGDGCDSLCRIVGEQIGGEIIPLETTSLILASAQTFSWMIPVVLSVLGIGLFVIKRKNQ